MTPMLGRDAAPERVNADKAAPRPSTLEEKVMSHHPGDICGLPAPLGGEAFDGIAFVEFAPDGQIARITNFYDA